MSCRAIAGLLALLTLSVACAHGVELRSEPPGAEVFIDGERVGTTPLTWQETTSHAGDVTVSVRGGETEARFALARKGFAPEPILAGVGLGAAALALGTAGVAAGYVLLIGSVLTALALPVSLGLLGASTALIAVSAGLLGSAWLAPLVAAGELGRKGPDRVLVDFEAGRVTTDPQGYEVPLIGVSPGYRPLRAPLEGRGLAPILPQVSEEPEADAAPPALDEPPPPSLPAEPGEGGRSEDRQAAPLTP